MGPGPPSGSNEDASSGSTDGPNGANGDDERDGTAPRDGVGDDGQPFAPVPEETGRTADDGDVDAPGSGTADDGDADAPGSGTVTAGDAPGPTTDAGDPGRRGGGVVGRLDLRRWLGRYLLLSVGLFAVATFFGWALAQPLPLGEVDPSTTADMAFMPVTFTVGGIFWHNLGVAVITAGGVVSFGLASAATLLLNGFLLGFVFGAAAKIISPGVALALILPHAVFEIPAFWLVASAAFRTVHRFVRYLAGDDETILSRTELVELGVVFALAVAMLVVAAWIEVRLTPGFGRFVAGG